MQGPLQNPQQFIVYGIDPGSSTSWATTRALVSNEPEEITHLTGREWDISDLDELIQEILDGTDECPSSLETTPVIVTLDAPLKMPTEFDVPITGLPGRNWPFNVNPFSTRPCEKFLSSRPEIIENNLEHAELVDTIRQLCNWGPDLQDPQNQRFTDIHVGVSVLGFQGAPHGPVVRLFRNRLEARLAETGFNDVDYSPWNALTPEAGHVYVLESHPAVSMALWAYQDGNTLPRYKGNNQPETQANFEALCAIVRALAAPRLDLDALAINDDNDLDAFVGFLNAVDLVRGKGDWIGTDEWGYFLCPKIAGMPEGQLMSEIWRNEAARVVALP
jgi:hypothetical protein